MHQNEHTDLHALFFVAAHWAFLNEFDASFIQSLFFLLATCQFIFHLTCIIVG